MTLEVLAWPHLNNSAANAYTRLLYQAVLRHNVRVHEYSARAVLRKRYDIFHMHWPDWTLNKVSAARRLLSVSKLLVVLVILRARRTGIVWTVHNLEPHSNAMGGLPFRLLYAGLRWLVQCQIHLTPATAVEMRTRRHASFGGRIEVIPHGLYERSGTAPARDAARARLGVANASAVVVFVGGIDRYKGVGDLIECFRELDDTGLALLVSGHPSSAALAQELREQVLSDPRVRVRFGFVSEEEFVTHIAAADLIAMPYRSGLNSGSIFHALTYDRPVLVPASPTFDFIRTQMGDGCVRTYEGRLTPEHLALAIQWGRSAKCGASSSAPTWDNIAAETVAVFKSLLPQGSAAHV